MNRRTKALAIRFSEAEWEALNEKVRQAKMPRERFCRKVLLGAKLNAAPKADYVYLIGEVRRLGININQLAKAAHINYATCDYQMLDAALKENHRVSDLLCETFRKEAK